MALFGIMQMLLEMTFDVLVAEPSGSVVGLVNPRKYPSSVLLVADP
jgi:hypothetical protein